MQTFTKLVLLVVASATFGVGLMGAIIFFPDEITGGSQAIGQSPQNRLSWQTSLASGSAQALKDHKYVLADVYTDWCGWCKKLDRDVFTDARVVSYLQKDFVCVKVNAEDPAEGKTVAENNHVEGYPCALVFSPEGKVIGRVEGYKGPKQYISTLKKITAAKAASK